MKFNELEVSKNRRSRRVGRGISAGRGKTAGRGTKGQKSRAGSSKKPGFEGGQNPLIARLPKLRGFKQFRDPTVTITTAQLSNYKGLVDNFTLYEAKYINKPDRNVKVVFKGELKNKVDVKLQGASQNAIDAIIKAGGSFQQTDRPKSTAKTSEK